MKTMTFLILLVVLIIAEATKTRSGSITTLKAEERNIIGKISNFFAEKVVAECELGRTRPLDKTLLVKCLKKVTPKISYDIKKNDQLKLDIKKLLEIAVSLAKVRAKFNKKSLPGDKEKLEKNLFLNEKKRLHRKAKEETGSLIGQMLGVPVEDGMARSDFNQNLAGFSLF